MISSIKNIGSLVKFSHSIFALPFALSMLVVCAEKKSISAPQILWIIVALVAARTAAMGFNRLIDRHIDAKNPRTAKREIPVGVVSARSAGYLVLMASMIFLYASFKLGLHCLVLAPLVLGWLFFYSYCKRFTSFAHIVLGVSLAMAPGGVWYALMGTFAWQPVPLMIAVALWVAGFDIIYACQDTEFDKSSGLHSIPVKLGPALALTYARLLHLGAILGFATFGVIFELGLPFWIAYLVFITLIASQHFLVSASDFSKADAVFFTRNGMAAIVFLSGVLISAWV